MPSALRSLVAGNWKMNGSGAKGAALANGLAARARADPARAEVLVCPPVVLLGTVRSALNGTPIVLGAQDCHAEPKGAHTGDVSAEMLAEAGCHYVIVGHSERRAGRGERDADVRAKADAAHRAGLVAIVCLGESAGDRERGHTLEVVTRQFDGSLPTRIAADDTVIAYEPVWAIGSGRVPSAAEIEAVHGHLRHCLVERMCGAGEDVRILYGGSVTPANCHGLLRTGNVNGVLVGGASLIAADFWSIVAKAP